MRKLVMETYPRCPVCGSAMEKIGGWDDDGNPAKLSTYWCPKCKHAIVEKSMGSSTGSTISYVSS